MLFNRTLTRSITRNCHFLSNKISNQNIVYFSTLLDSELETNGNEQNIRYRLGKEHTLLYETPGPILNLFPTYKSANYRNIDKVRPIDRRYSLYVRNTSTRSTLKDVNQFFASVPGVININHLEVSSDYFVDFSDLCHREAAKKQLEFATMLGRRVWLIDRKVPSPHQQDDVVCSHTLLVTGLPLTTTTSMVINAFSKYGDIFDVLMSNAGESFTAAVVFTKRDPVATIISESLTNPFSINNTTVTTSLALTDAQMVYGRINTITQDMNTFTSLHIKNIPLWWNQGDVESILDEYSPDKVTLFDNSAVATFSDHETAKIAMIGISGMTPHYFTQMHNISVPQSMSPSKKLMSLVSPIIATRKDFAWEPKFRLKYQDDPKFSDPIMSTRHHTEMFTCGHTDIYVFHESPVFENFTSTLSVEHSISFSGEMPVSETTLRELIFNLEDINEIVFIAFFPSQKKGIVCYKESDLTKMFIDADFTLSNYPLHETNYQDVVGQRDRAISSSLLSSKVSSVLKEMNEVDLEYDVVDMIFASGSEVLLKCLTNPKILEQIVREKVYFYHYMTVRMKDREFGSVFKENRLREKAQRLRDYAETKVQVNRIIGFQSIYETEAVNNNLEDRKNLQFICEDLIEKNIYDSFKEDKKQTKLSRASTIFIPENFQHKISKLEKIHFNSELNDYHVLKASQINDEEINDNVLNTSGAKWFTQVTNDVCNFDIIPIRGVYTNIEIDSKSMNDLEENNLLF